MGSFLGWHYVGPVTENPTTLEFVASPDHDLLDTSGDPIVTRYELRFYPASGGDLVAAVDLGRPTPVDGLVTIVDAAMFSGLAAGSYRADVVTVSSDGNTDSVYSDVFTIS